MIPKPAPPRRRVCTRYTEMDQPCLETTTRIDGWCGNCAGFPAPDAQLYNPNFDSSRQAPPSSITEWVSVEGMPLTADEAYEVSVPLRPQHLFSQTHGCSLHEAEVQIRSLLEDIILEGIAERGNGDGPWRLRTPAKDFTLTLSADRAAVVSYRSVHRERTPAQVKAGVASRAPVKWSNKEFIGPRLPSKRQFMNSLIASVADVQIGVRCRITPRAISEYSKLYGFNHTPRNKGYELVREMAELLAKLVEDWQPGTDGGQTDVIERNGLKWTLRHDGRGGDAALLSVTRAQ